MVEINPHVAVLRDEFEVPPDSDRFSVILGDGATTGRQKIAMKFRAIEVDKGLLPRRLDRRLAALEIISRRG